MGLCDTIWRTGGVPGLGRRRSLSALRALCTPKRAVDDTDDATALLPASLLYRCVFSSGYLSHSTGSSAGLKWPCTLRYAPNRENLRELYSGYSDRVSAVDAC